MPIDASARCGSPGIGIGLRRLLLEADDALGRSSTATTPKRVAVLDRHLDGRQVRSAPLLLVGAQHPAVVHLVDVVAGQDDDVPRGLALDRVDVLVDGVGGAQVPVLADALLRRQDLDELAEFLRHDVPAHADVPVERQRLVLRGDEDAAQPRVDAVGEDEVDDPVGPAEVDGRLGPVARERRQALAGAPGEHDDQCVVSNHGGLSLRQAGRPRLRRRKRAASPDGPESTTPVPPSRWDNSLQSMELGALTRPGPTHMIAN